MGCSEKLRRYSEVVVATVDGGGDWQHEDLRANVWTNEDEIPDNGIDDDNNGFIDDVHGVNFANGDDTNNDPTGLPKLPGSARHGTAVAGSASAVTNNNVGVAGAAWNAEIMHINAGCDSVDNYICYGYEGILYAATNGADIINASWASYVSDDQGTRHLDQTLELATDMGALVVAAASNYSLSNDLFRYYPARSPRVLSVGATEKATRRRAGFSNYGRLVNVFAPGVGILTTGPDNSYVLFNGTSFSSPLTAGVAALVKTRFPTMDPDALREHIRLTSETIDSENPGFAGQLGRGLVNALDAVRAPTSPAVRLKRWSWTDQDSDLQIASGDVVTIKATVINYLSDASGLSVGLVGAEPYSFLDMTAAEVEVGFLAGGDSIEVEFEFRVATDAPDNQWVRLYTRIQDGAFEDGADQLSFRVNLSLAAVHRSLIAFYRATDGDNWIRNDNWDITRVPSEEELDRWVGVLLNEGFLVELVMRANNLSGTLPPELGNLRNLVALHLSENEGLTGQIPSELGALERLQVLSLSYNSLSGSIPPELGSLGKLRGLDLSHNALSGAIPPELQNLEQLRGLDLSRNSLSGTIPPQLGNLEQLRELWLHRNSLSGPIPPELGSLKGLWMLSLWGNSLSGSIPPELGNLKQLEVLDLPYNELSGPIPPELGNLTQLIILNANNNFLSGPVPPELGNLEQLLRLYLNGNSLSGPIPSEIGNLEQLQELRLHRNSLSGSIPPELGNLDQLQWLYLQNNSISGPIPPELASLEKLQELDVSDNSLSEPIPPELANLKRLQELRLSGNSLSGPIPPEFGNLVQLQELFLSRNSLFGPIPPELGNLGQLQWLNLSDNSLSESIPLELGNLAQLQDLSLGANSLSGSIPPELGSLEQLQVLVLNFNSLSGSIPPEIGKLSRLKQLHLNGNAFTGQLPRSLIQLDSLEAFQFGGQDLCAPADDEFQMWLKSIPNHSGPTCTATALHFASDIPDQSFPRTLPITPLILPEAQGGISPIAYTLIPTLPDGLVYDSLTRTISGAPTMVTSSPIPYTFKATDATGETDSLVFSIEVFSPVASEQKGLPESFMVRGNYPNPFRKSTHLVIDLPWSATLNVEVFDVMGRRLLSPAPVDLTAGWSRSIRLEGTALPSGLYLYRIRANSPVGIHRQAGRFLRVR